MCKEKVCLSTSIPLVTLAYPSSQPDLKDCGNKPRANVVSISYSTGTDIVDFTPELQRQCAEYGKVCTH